MLTFMLYSTQAEPPTMMAMIITVNRNVAVVAGGLGGAHVQEVHQLHQQLEHAQRHHADDGDGVRQRAVHHRPKEPKVRSSDSTNPVM